MPRILRFITASLMVMLHLSSLGQADSLKTKQETEKPPRTIELSGVPIRSLEVESHVKQAFKDMLPPNTVRKYKLSNDLVMAMIDTSLMAQIDPNSPAINLKYLQNRRYMLLEEQKTIDEAEASLREIINPIDTLSNWISRESEAWKNTIKLHAGETLEANIIARMNSTVSFLDSALASLNARTQTLSMLLERTMAMSVSLDLSLERTNLLLSRKERNSLAVDSPPFFSLEFSKNYFREVSLSLLNLKNVKLREIRDYLADHMEAFIGLLFVFVLVYLVFRRLKARIRINMEGVGRFYKDMFILMLSQPMAGSVIITLTLSYLFFPGRPVSFRELQTYIVAIPMIFLMNRMLQRHYRFYFYVFTVTVLLYMIQILLSPETTIYRVSFFLISVVETVLLSLLLHRIRTEKMLNSTQKRWLYGFFALNVLLAIAGFIANVTGRVTLTEMLLNAVFSSILSSVILFISALLANGMITGGIDSQTGKKVNTFVKYGELIKKRAIRIINILAVVLWINIVLAAFHLDTLVLGMLAAMFTYQFKVGTISFSISLLLVFWFVILLSYYFARYLQVLLEEDLLNRLPLAKGLPHTIAMAMKYTLIVCGFFLAVNATGMPLDKVTIILGAFSVGIGFGLQNIFNNMVSGLILLFERPIQLGDTVQVGQLTGQVKSIDLRSSNIHTFDGAEVIVPNGQLVSSEVINWTLSDKKRRLEIPVGVGYESDPAVVSDLLMGVMMNNPRVLKTPDPMVLFSGLGQSSLDFVLVFWIADYNDGRIIKSDVLFGVFRTLKEKGIKIPFPQTDVHIIPDAGS